MNNNIFNRSFLIIIFLSFIFNSNFLAEENSDKVKQEIKKNIAKAPSLLLLRNYYKYDLENNYNLYSKKFYTTEEEESYSKKSPWIALILSYFIPSAGQYYNGEYVKALLIDTFLLIGFGLLMLGAMSIDYDSESNPRIIGTFLYSGLIIGGGAWAYSVIDAPISANRINARNKRLTGIKIFSSPTGKYSINLDYSKLNKNYLLGMQYNF